MKLRELADIKQGLSIDTKYLLKEKKSDGIYFQCLQATDFSEGKSYYLYQKTVTRKRFIFCAGISKDRIFLSIDLEKGGFEVCNFKGVHLGEYFFDGTKTGSAQSSHNIKVRI